MVRTCQELLYDDADFLGFTACSQLPLHILDKDSAIEGGHTDVVSTLPLHGNFRHAIQVSVKTLDMEITSDVIKELQATSKQT